MSIDRANSDTSSPAAAEVAGEPVTVLGAGSFGTALANVLASSGRRVTLWAHSAAHAAEMQALRENRRYHPGFPLESSIELTDSLETALTGRRWVVAVVPSHVTRSVMAAAIPHLHPSATVICATKGIENESLLLMSQLMESLLPESNRHRTAYLSGPSFAKEMIQRLPTVVTIAAQDPSIAADAQKVFNSDVFRVYTSDDVVGVEVAGAVKNVMAIAAGIADGLGFGHNTRAAIITRGLAEITRVGLKLGATPMTFMGLAGVGDLVLTCTGDLSRNRTVGLRLGKGEKLADILAGTHQVAEGVKTTRAVYDLSHKLGVEMPIVDAVFSILYQDKSPRLAVSELMGRPVKREQG